MKILYIGCHGVLEYNEITMFREMGHDVFSTGVYFHPDRPCENLRPELELTEFSLNMIKMFSEYSVNLHKPLPQKIVDAFDVIIVVHEEKYIWQNIKTFQNKPVFFRAIGQENHNTETSIDRFRNEFGFKVVGFSNMEKTKRAFSGRDDYIYMHSYAADVAHQKVGTDAITFIRNMTNPLRYRWCNTTAVTELQKIYPLKVYGFNNPAFIKMENELPLNYIEHSKILHSANSYFFTGSYPAFYTLAFIEAFSSGTPVVAIKNPLGESELDKIIINGENGFLVESVEEAAAKLAEIRHNDGLRSSISAKAISQSKEIFSKERAKEQWTELFSSLS